MAGTVRWSGASGQSYMFEVYPWDQEFNPVSGVYIACRYTAPHMLEALYVGQTKSFFNRLNAGFENHDGLERAKSAGATELAVMVVNNESDRLRIETDLRHGLNPVCNRQGTPSLADLLYRE